MSLLLRVVVVFLSVTRGIFFVHALVNKVSLLTRISRLSVFWILDSVLSTPAQEAALSVVFFLKHFFSVILKTAATDAVKK